MQGESEMQMQSGSWQGYKAKRRKGFIIHPPRLGSKYPGSGTRFIRADAYVMPRLGVGMAAQPTNERAETSILDYGAAAAIPKPAPFPVNGV